MKFVKKNYLSFLKDEKWSINRLKKKIKIINKINHHLKKKIFSVSGIKLVLKFYDCTYIKTTKSKKKYNLGRVYFLFKCSNNHFIEKDRTYIKTSFQKKRGTLCWSCYKNSLKLNNGLQIAEKIAKDRGGKFLSKKFNTTRENYNWKCKFNHKWKASFTNIQRGSWCPKCNDGLGERLTRIAFEKIFNKKFIKIRPDWLKGKKANLELDGYNSELKLAFEHEGSHKILKQEAFGRGYFNSPAYKRYIKNISYKKRICKKKGIKLINIPEVPSLTKIDDLKFLIKAKLKSTKNKYIRKCLNNINTLNINYNTAYGFNNIILLKAKAKEHGGVLISKFFLGSDYKYKFKCRNDHIFFRTFRHAIYRDQFCASKKCMEQRKIENLIKNNKKFKNLILSSRNSQQAAVLVKEKLNPGYKSRINNKKSKKASDKFLSTLNKKLKENKSKLIQKINFVQTNTLIKIKCEKGHIFETKKHGILYNNTWCPEYDCIMKKKLNNLIKKNPKLKKIIKRHKISHPNSIIHGNYS